MSAPATARLQRTGLGFFIVALLCGCSTVNYYGQAASGQFQLLTARRPVAEVLKDPATPAETRRLLASSQAIRRYATQRLGLPDNGSYSSYADIGRPNVVWNVTATPEFSLQPLQHCFPVVGCLDYRGFFSKDAAEQAAAELRGRGYDTYVSTATAFSSLGWFEDPLLNTMLRWDEVRLAEVMFHELAHQRLYVKGDSAFSEAFAMVVQNAGVRQWLRETGRSGMLPEYEARESRRNEFLQLVRSTREDLRQIYGLGLRDRDSLLRAKALRIERLRADYRKLRRHWNDEPSYDGWFSGEINNAKLSLVGTYSSDVPALTTLLVSNRNNLLSFYEDAFRIAALSPEQRGKWIENTHSRPDDSPGRSPTS